MGQNQFFIEFDVDEMSHCCHTDNILKPDSLRWFTQRRSPTPHFGVCGDPGGDDHQIRTRPKFLCSAHTPKFHHHVFTCPEVIVLTNKQTDTAVNIQRSSLRYDVWQIA